ncbi:hypothetical protein CBR_g51053 [Chara braunii]|nr:hypothetical protein CBR_g51053 [Chara braunii]|eukprot:GBG65459.1 hypothetical protein CBR_g51053 [Chara braunii]
MEILVDCGFATDRLQQMVRRWKHLDAARCFAQWKRYCEEVAKYQGLQDLALNHASNSYLRKALFGLFWARQRRRDRCKGEEFQKLNAQKRGFQSWRKCCKNKTAKKLQEHHASQQHARRECSKAIAALKRNAADRKRKGIKEDSARRHMIRHRCSKALKAWDFHLNGVQVSRRGNIKSVLHYAGTLARKAFFQWTKWVKDIQELQDVQKGTVFHMERYRMRVAFAAWRRWAKLIIDVRDKVNRFIRLQQLERRAEVLRIWSSWAQMKAYERETRTAAQGRTFVPTALPTGQTRTGRWTSGGDNPMTRRSPSTDSGGERSDGADDTNALMCEYFVQMAEKHRERVEREREEERRRLEEEARRVKESRRALREEQRLRHEEDRDIRLMWILRSEFRKEQEGDLERDECKGKRPAKSFSRNDGINEEKERLRRSIAQRTIGIEEMEDEELVALRKQAATLDLLEKRKRGPDLPVGNSPPIVTREKQSSTRLSNEAKARIELLKGDLTKEAGMSSAPSRIDLSLKHIMASCGLGRKEKSEQECHDFYDAVTIEELKETCRREKVAYGNRDLAIKCLITRRSAVAYDPSTILPPSTPSVATRASKGKVALYRKNEGKSFSLLVLSCSKYGQSLPLLEVVLCAQGSTTVCSIQSGVAETTPSTAQAADKLVTGSTPGNCADTVHSTFDDNPDDDDDDDDVDDADDADDDNVTNGVDDETFDDSTLMMMMVVTSGTLMMITKHYRDDDVDDDDEPRPVDDADDDDDDELMMMMMMTSSTLMMMMLANLDDEALMMMVTNISLMTNCAPDSLIVMTITVLIVLDNTSKLRS